jgi:Pectate lyase superfamily protein
LICEVIEVITLDKKHDPRNNPLLIKNIQQHSFTIQETINKTESLFKESCLNTQITIEKRSLIEWIKWMALSPKVKKVNYKNVSTTQLCYDSDESVYPNWKAKLDLEYDNLFKQIKGEVNVKDFGAKGDGNTDDTESFKKAIGKGRVMVHVPEGIYVVKGIKVPSFTCLKGEGKGRTILKLHDHSSKAEWLITNKKSSYWQPKHSNKGNEFGLEC